jgi:hypothetical protein
MEMVPRWFCLCFRKIEEGNNSNKEKNDYQILFIIFRIGLSGRVVRIRKKKIFAYICGKIEENDSSEVLGADEKNI